MTDTIILAWVWNADLESLTATSIYYEDMTYLIEPKADEWEAFFDGYPLAKGDLQNCIQACVESEMEGQKESVAGS